MADLDHTTMNPPHLRVVEAHARPSGDVVYKWDLRISQPNVSAVNAPTLHSIEHFLNVHVRDRWSPDGSRGVFLVAPMGCQTGFYVMALNIGEYDEMAALVGDALGSIATATAVPLANVVSCGWARLHSLEAAQDLAAWLLDRRESWGVFGPGVREVSP